jgi:hypothetical protein
MMDHLVPQTKHIINVDVAFSNGEQKGATSVDLSCETSLGSLLLQEVVAFQTRILLQQLKYMLNEMVFCWRVR